MSLTCCVPNSVGDSWHVDEFSLDDPSDLSNPPFRRSSNLSSTTLFKETIDSNFCFVVSALIEIELI